MNLRSEQILKKKSRHKLVDTNQLTTEHIYIFSLKYPAQFVPGIAVINSQIPMNKIKPPKSISRNFILLLVSTRINPPKKCLVRKRRNPAAPKIFYLEI